MAKKPRRVALMLELRWPFKRHAEVFAGTQRYAQEQGWESILDEFVDKTLQSHPSSSIPYDGIIARVNKKLALKAKQLNIPLVNVWFSSPNRKELPGVYPDFETTGRIIAEHLLARGLRNFAALEREDYASKVEIASFCSVVNSAGCRFVIATLPLEPMSSYVNWKKSQTRLDAWMDKWTPPIGVFVHADEVGRMVAQLCLRRGWRIPQDVSLISGSNEETYCLHPWPSLSSVERGYEHIGYEAARLLNELMDNKLKAKRKKETTEVRQILLPPKSLVVRESTDFFSVNDELVAAALEFIAANAHRRIGQTEVSRAVNSETRTLQNRFRKVLDCPIVAVIRQVRIERAKRELVQSNRTLKQIARDSGFGEPVRMNEVFRRELGITPSQYRKQRQMN